MPSVSRLVHAGVVFVGLCKRLRLNDISASLIRLRLTCSENVPSTPLNCIGFTATWTRYYASGEVESHGELFLASYWSCITGVGGVGPLCRIHASL